ATACRCCSSTSAIPRRKPRNASRRAARAAPQGASTRPNSMRWPPKSSWSAGLNTPDTPSTATSALQFADDGRLRHLLTLADMPREHILALLKRAEHMRAESHGGSRPLDLLAGRTVINLFFEPSTRTRTSFDLAAQRLGAQVINFDIASSSTVK